MSGIRQRWPRFMHRRYGPPDGTWYCCGGKLMRSMPVPSEPGVTWYLCPHCGLGLRAKGAEVLEVLPPRPEEDEPAFVLDLPGQQHIQF